MNPDTYMDVRRLAREDVLLAEFGAGQVATLLPRGERLVAVSRDELPTPLE